MNDTRMAMRKWEVIDGCDPAVIAAHLLCRPHVVFKPSVFVDGDKWCALYGENLQEGVRVSATRPRKLAVLLIRHGKNAEHILQSQSRMHHDD